MQRYRPTIATVEATQYDGTSATVPHDVVSVATSPLTVQTPDGPIEVSIGDWLVRNRAGDYAVLADAQFRLHYELDE
jgi:hypothetical protein